MPFEPYPLVLYVHYAGLMVFALGVVATLRASDPKMIQRAAYVVAGAGFLMAWGGGHLSAEFSDRELFSLVNVVGFLGLAATMNFVHWRAANTVTRPPSKELGGWFNLRRFGWIEGASLVLLMFVAMPMKYLADMDEMVRYVGMAHGWLFMIFVVWVALAARKGGWPMEKTLGALVASVIPFGPFVADLAE
jgi:integral membrane protein